MNALPLLPDLETVALRCVWFQEPAETLSDPVHFIAYVLTFGTHDDVKVLRRHVTDDELRSALDNAPPGVFDPRSWAYWNLMLGRDCDSPMPVRRFS